MGERWWGGKITGAKLDGAEGIRGVGVSWINRGDGGAEGVRVVVTYLWLFGSI